MHLGARIRSRVGVRPRPRIRIRPRVRVRLRTRTAEPVASAFGFVTFPGATCATDPAGEARMRDARRLRIRRVR